MKAISLLKKRLNDSMKVIRPKHYAERRLEKLQRTFHEPELRLIPCLCDREKISLDIGAAEGIFTAHILRNSRHCTSFEPRSRQAEELRFILSRTRSAASVEAIALSNTRGISKLRMLAEDPGRSTIEHANSLEDEDGSSRLETTVPIKQLDDYGFKQVGFIKIDVEGHELAVLQGGVETLADSRPTLLIEIENRHRQNAIEDVSSLLSGLGYQAYFINGRELYPLSSFDQKTHQNPANIGGWKSGWKKSGIYINNFIFVHADNVAEVTRDIRACLKGPAFDI